MKAGNAAFDLADRLAEGERAAGVARAQAALRGDGERHCVDCGEAIEAARRRALPNARRCIECQRLRDQSQRRGI
ncbi:MAG: TraR/DksA C4-type zinc finger protein [Nitratireductor sp.]|uniref:TraR/DksA C4-type zinc finger protein n=1 Tax=Parvibaculum sp. TaxID=2024848 RepID=UPI003283300C